MTLRKWLLVVTLFIAVQALAGFIWWWGAAHAAHRDNGGALTWSFPLAAVPIAAAMYWCTRRWSRSHGRQLAAVVVLSPVVSAVVATTIALVWGTSVSLNTLLFPYLGCSFGWQVARGFGGEAPVTGTSGAPGG